MWVDGSDPEWIKEKKKYAPTTIDDTNDVNRFRDWNLMKYWFRSIEKFIPWARNIIFVTWGHIPPFLKTDHPKLRIVRHDEFMPKDALPTFSSCAIELNLHRIKGLSEYFILFNDDMFITKKLPQSYFFKKGLPCTRYAEWPFKCGLETWSHNASNDIFIINKHFNKKKQFRANFFKYISFHYRWFDNLRTLFLNCMFPYYYSGFINLHQPAAYLKSTFRKVWSEEPELLLSTTHHRFRDKEDLNQWIMLWWQCASGQFMPQKINSMAFSTGSTTINSICKAIQKQSYDMICINDTSDDTNFTNHRKKIENAFERLLPQKSSFEL